jgi:hypothetical protein
MHNRILITEEALRDREGHWFEYNRATKAALLEFNPSMVVDMLGNRTMDASVADELKATPHFRYTVWDQIYNKPQAWKRYFGIVQHNFRLYQDLAQHLHKSDPYDAIFAPTVVLHHLLAYHAIANRFAGRKLNQLVLLIRNNIANYDQTGKRTFRGTAKFWRWAIRRFQPLIAKGQVRFVTDSERLADEYEELTGIRFAVLPHPSLVATGYDHAVRTNVDGRPIRIFLPGPARFEKGSDKLEGIVNLFSTATNLDLPRVEFVVQWAEPFSLPDGRMCSSETFRNLDTDKVSVCIHREPLSSAQYREELCDADIILLPYRCAAYFARISGVAVEAMILGKPCVFTANTWVHTIAERFGLGTACDETEAGVFLALASTLNSLADRRRKSMEKKTEIAGFFSPKSFASMLLANRE